MSEYEKKVVIKWSPKGLAIGWTTQPTTSHSSGTHSLTP